MKTQRSPSDWTNSRQRRSHYRSLWLGTWTNLVIGCLLLVGVPSSCQAFLPSLPNTFAVSAYDPSIRNRNSHTSMNVAQLPHTMPPTEEASEDDPLSREDYSDEILSSENSMAKKPKGIAIVLNSNARGVSKDMIQAIQGLAFQYNDEVMRVYSTSTKEQAEQAVLDLKRNRPQVVVPIGGDGTLTTMIQMLYDANVTPLPYIGYLPMGTGNALGTVIGCNPRRRIRKKKRLQAIQDVIQKLLEIAQKIDEDQANGDHGTIHEQVDVVDVPLMHVTTTSSSDKNMDGALDIKQQVYCFFAGIGFDSLMLQDYKELQEWSSKSRLWKDKFASVWGYTVALFTRTLPKCVTHQSHLVELEVSTNEPALWVDHRRGDVVRKVRLVEDEDGETKSTSTLLYKGQAGIVAASTTPFYGGNLKLFPFARLSENGCQVRIGRIHPLVGVVNIPQIFSGAYRNSEMGCLDFIGTQFSVDIQNDGHPVQHSGESMGLAQKVELQVLKTPVRFVTLLPPRLVCETED